MRLSKRLITLVVSAAMVWNNLGSPIAEGYQIRAARDPQPQSLEDEGTYPQGDLSPASEVDTASGSQEEADQLAGEAGEQSDGTATTEGPAVDVGEAPSTIGDVGQPEGVIDTAVEERLGDSDPPDASGQGDLATAADEVPIDAQSPSQDAATSENTVPEEAGVAASGDHDDADDPLTDPGQEVVSGEGGSVPVATGDDAADGVTADPVAEDGTSLDDAGDDIAMGDGDPTGVEGPEEPAADADGMDAEESPLVDVAPEEVPAQEQAIESTLTLAEGGTYRVTVTYGEEAGVPEGATLALREYTQIPEHYGEPEYAERFRDRPLPTETFLSKDDLSARLDLVAKGLALEEGLDDAYHAKLLRVEMVDSEGQTINLRSTLRVLIETNAIDIADSPAVEVGYFDPTYDAATMPPEEAVRPIATSNLTEDKSREEFDRDLEHPLRTRLELSTDHLGTLAIMCVARAKAVWEQGDERVVLRAAGSLDAYAEPWGDPGDLGEGVEALGAWWVRFATEPAYGARAWLATSAIEGADARPEGTGFAAWRLSEPAGQLFEAAGTATPAELAPGDVFALGWDATVAEPEAEAQDGTVAAGSDAEGGDASSVGEEGEGRTPASDGGSTTAIEGAAPAVPKGSTPGDGPDSGRDASDATEPAVGEGEPVAPIGGEEQGHEPGTDTMPAPDDPATTTDPAGDASDTGLPVPLDETAPDAAGKDDAEAGVPTTTTPTPLFAVPAPEQLEEFVSYESRFVASDGRTYRVTAGFEAPGAVPAGASLSVREIVAGTREYLDYVSAAAGELSVDHADVSFARAFDIAFVDPVTGAEYEPISPANVRIELLSDSLSDVDQTSVVHFGDTPEVIEATQTGDAVAFEAGSFSVYVVVQVVQERLLTASDGRAYKVTVSYDTASGIPEDAALQVAELATDDPRYDEYVRRAADVRGREARQLDFAHAFDIALANPATGERYQPSKDVRVSIELMGESVAVGDGIHITHFPGTSVADDVEAVATPPEVLDSVVRDGAIEFETGSFSVYIVDKDALMRRYVFLNDSDGEMDAENRDHYIFAEQVLTDGETLVMPPMPYKPGAVFDRWVNEDGTDATFPQTISLKADEVEGDDHDAKQAYLDAHPVYFEAIYEAASTVVTFYNQSGIVVDRRSIERPAAGEAAATLDTNEVTYLAIQDKQDAIITFQYWTEDSTDMGAKCGTDGDGILRIDSSSPDEMSLYPYLTEGHYLHLDSNKDTFGIDSATYIGPETVNNVAGNSDAEIALKAQAVCDALNARDNHAIPTANGYDFTGWYISSAEVEGVSDTPVFAPNEDGTSLTVDVEEYRKLLSPFGNLAKNHTLYAHWKEKATANYTVVIWTQKLTEDGKAAMVPGDDVSLEDCYSYQKNFTIDAATGTVKDMAEVNADVKRILEETAECNLKNLQDLAMYNRIFKTNETDKEKNPFYGFTYSTANSDTEVTVKSDGSTIMNIYYDRIMHRLSFVRYDYNRVNNPGNYRDDLYGYVNALSNYIKLVWSGGYNGSYYFEYGGNNYRYSQYGSYYYTRLTNIVKYIDKQYGVNIVDDFPNTSIEGYAGTQWSPQNSETYTYQLATLETMPNEDISFIWTSQSDVNTIIYYKETDQSDSDAVSFNDKWYKESKRAQHGFNFITYAEEYHPIIGYTRDGNNAVPAFGEIGYVVNQNNSLQEIQDNNIAVIGGRTKNRVTESNINRLYYDRETYHVYYYDPQGRGGTATYIKDDPVKYSVAVGPYANSFAPTPSSDAYRFVGWYMDPTCKTKAFFDQVSYDSASLAEGETKELILTMPARNIQLYAKWTPIKNRALVIPNGGELATATNEPFHLEAEEKVALADPTRDYLKVEEGETGLYTYDPINGKYLLTEDESGDYEQSAGAYHFQGWYEAVLDNPGEKKIVEYKPGGYTYAYGEYQQVADGSGHYDLVEGTTDTYILNAEGTGAYDFVNAQPRKNADGSYVLGRRFDPDSAPTKPVTIIAGWQRAGGFQVRYQIKDPALTNLSDSDYRGIAAPEDDNEYIDGAHAIAEPANSAPRGYTLEYWTDKNGARYKPNELVPVRENNATPDSSGNYMVVTLTAHYREFTPSERNMADYTFLTNVVQSGDSYVFGSEYTTYELQRIAVNEELKPPLEPPVPAGSTFRGWYYDKAGTRKFDGFGIITNPLYTTLYAVYDQTFTVTYYLTKVSTGTDGKPTYTPTNTVLATQTYTNPGAGSPESAYQVLDTRRVTHPVDVDHYVTLWYKRGDEATKYPYNSISTTRVTSDLELDAHLVERSYAVFDSRGGTYVNKQEITENGWPYPPDEPKREGYHFAGWWSEARGGDQYDFTRPLSEFFGEERMEYTLYAHWVTDGNPHGKLQVIFWAQTADRPEDDDVAARDREHYQMIDSIELDYQYGDYLRDELKTTALASYVRDGEYDIVATTQTAYDSHSASAAAFVEDTLGYKGNNADVTDALWNAPGRIADLQHYYAFNASKSDEEVSVDSNDNGVLNIRFDLKTYALEFLPDGKAEISYGGVTHPADGSNNYRVPIWLNRPISAQWPAESLVDEPDAGHASFVWTDTASSFYAWKYRAYAASVSGGQLSITQANKEARTPINVADKFIVDTARERPGGVLQLTVGSNAETLDKVGVVHYLVREGDTTEFRELSDLRTYIKVPEKPTWADNTTTGLPRIAGSYAGFKESTCWEHGSPARHPGVKYAFTVLEPLGLSGYEQLENEHAHAGDLLNPDGGQDDGQTDGKNTSGLYNLVSNRRAYAQVIFDKGDPTYLDYFASHPDQYVDEEGVYNLYYYYKPIKFELSFFTDPASQFGSSQQVYCGEDLNSIIASIGEPTPPEGSTVTFRGWALSPYQRHEDAAYTGTTMPSHNLALYAIWEPYQFSVTTVGVDENGGYFEVDGDREVDEQGNLVPGGRTSAVYWANAGQELRELRIPNPKHEGWLFKGWVEEESNSPVTAVYRVRSHIRIRPNWDRLDTRTISYDANVPASVQSLFAGRPASPGAPVDENEYVVGAKAIIMGGNNMFIYRRDVDGKVYRASFAYWEDDDGFRYYPNTTYVFRDSSPQVLELKAIYSEYRETALYYNLNPPNKTGVDARFVLQDDTSRAYTNKLLDQGDYQGAHKGEVRVLFRDWLNEAWETSFKKKPNDVFPVGEDEDIDQNQEATPNPSKFTATCVDGVGNTYILAGWATKPDEHLAVFENGDLAYVNTIKEDTTNTLYAIWGICKIVDKDRNEHVFTVIDHAVDWAREHTDILPIVQGEPTATIQMLVDYTITEPVVIEGDDRVILTTAPKAATFTGERFFYRGEGTIATLRQGLDNRNVFTVKGESDFTMTNITMDSDQSVAHTLGIILVQGEGNVTLDAGATLQHAHVQEGTSHASSGGAIRSEGTGTVTLLDGSKILDCWARDGGAVFLQDGGTLNMEDGALISGCKCYYWGGAIQVRCGTANIKSGARIENCTAGYDLPNSKNEIDGRGGAILVNHEGGNAVLNVAEGAQIVNCRADRYGGAIYANLVTGNSLSFAGTIDGCEAASDGGGLYVTNANGVTTISGGEIKNSRALNGNGGGIYQDHGTVNIGGLSLSSNTASGNGGGIYQNNGTLSLANATLTSNTASGSGGGIYQYSGTLSLSDATVTSNVASGGSGGGWYLREASATCDGCSFVSNSAGTDGGGIYWGKNTTLNLATGTFTSNAASRNGGGIYVVNAPVSLGAVTIGGPSADDGNTATNGGGIYKANGTLTMNGTQLRNNRATASGGGIYNGSAAITISGGTIEDCSATGDGGGIYTKAGAFTMSDTAIRSCSAASGGGIYQAASTMTLRGTSSVIEGCAATANGGGIYHTKDTLDVGNWVSASDADNRVLITGCSAGGSGGGIYSADGRSYLRCKSEISNCVAASGGGIYHGNNTLSITDQAFITNCAATANTNGSSDPTAYTYSDANRGGAIYQLGGTIEIHMNQGVVSGCHAYDGGGVYTAAGTLYLGKNENGRLGTITQCGAEHAGGGVYLQTGTFEIRNGSSSIDHNTAAQGAGVYAANGPDAEQSTVVRMSAGKVVDNTASVSGGGIAVGGENVRLNFSGTVTVRDNTMPKDGATVACNVYLDQDSNAIINSNKLNAASYIGVYAEDTAIEGERTVFTEHGTSGMPFGTFANGDNLNRFLNDRVPYLYGMAGSEPNTIYWTIYNFKVTDPVGNLLYRDAAHTTPAVYEELGYQDSGGDRVNKYAFNAINQGTLYTASGQPYAGTEFVIETLTDLYTTSKKMNEWIGATALGKTVTLTTASRDEEDGFSYRGEPGTVATIKHGTDRLDAALFTLFGTLVLRDITLDGGAVIENGAYVSGPKITQAGALVALMDERDGVGPTLIIEDGATLQNAYNAGSSHNQGGGAISNRSQNRGKASHRVIMRGGRIVNCGTAGNGGAIQLVHGQFTMEGGTIEDCFAAADTSGKNGLGGAVHISNADASKPASFILTGGTIEGCTAVEGAGIYLSEGTSLEISGGPSFGGTGISTDGAIDTTAGNIASGDLGEGSTNGSVAYTKGRQDIYLAGYAGIDAASLVVAGDIDSGDGSIWVWAAELPHYKNGDQFARIAEGVTVEDSTLKAFRDARTDEDADNNGGSYLRGVRGENAAYVYWGADGKQKVIIKKVGEGHESLKGARFQLYSTSWARIKDEDAESMGAKDQEGKHPATGSSGVLFVGELSYGTYYLVETDFLEDYKPTGYDRFEKDIHSSYIYFKLTVGEPGKDLGGGRVIGPKGILVEGPYRRTDG